MQFMRETTGAVFDTLAQIHLIRGEHDEASRCLQKAREAYGESAMPAAGISGRCACWRRGWRCGAGEPARALALACDVADAPDAPAALCAAGGADRDRGAARRSAAREEAQERLEAIAGRVQPAR